MPLLLLDLAPNCCQARQGIKIILNGKEKVFPGNAGETRSYWSTGRKHPWRQSLKTTIKLSTGNREGTPRKLKISDILSQEKYLVFLNGQPTRPLAVSSTGKKRPPKSLKTGQAGMAVWNSQTTLDYGSVRKAPKLSKNGLEAGLEQHNPATGSRSAPKTTTLGDNTGQRCRLL